MKTIVLPPQKSSTALSRVAVDFACNAFSKNTSRAYRSDWEDFTGWCRIRALQFLPATPDTVATYIGELAARASLSTLRRRLVAISQAHSLAGHPSPTKSTTVRMVLRGITRTFADERKTVTRKSPLLLDDIRSMMRNLGTHRLKDVRDRALILLGFAGAFRRSELVALDVVDIMFGTEGAVAHLNRSKTDQAGAGFEKAIPLGRHEETCPVTALRRWIEATGISEGPLFRAITKGGVLSHTRLTDRSVSLVLKTLVRKAGLDGSTISGHSLRAGFVTEALIRGATYAHVQRQTGHKSLNMVGVYDRDKARFRNNAVMMLGL